VFVDGEEEEQEQTDGLDVVLDMQESKMIHLLQYGLPDEVEKRLMLGWTC
jgi:hypothetical protein